MTLLSPRMTNRPWFHTKSKSADDFPRGEIGFKLEFGFEFEFEFGFEFEFEFGFGFEFWI